MADTFSSALLAQFVDAFVDESARLAELNPIGQFRRADLARSIHFDHDTSDVTDPEQLFRTRFSRMLNGAAPLNRDHVVRTLEECRTHLAYQHDELANHDPEGQVADFERKVCIALKLQSDSRATADDFRQDRIFDAAQSVDELGFPDLIEWRDGTLGVSARLKTLQRRSIVVLRDLAAHIARLDNDDRRLRLLHIAISLAMFNHPGSPWHDQAHELVRAAAVSAQLERLTVGRGVPADRATQAARLSTHLHWARVMPTLNSPFNYMSLALRGERVPTSEWLRIVHHLEQSCTYSHLQCMRDPQSRQAVRERSSVRSMRARLLVASHRSGLLNEADRQFAESLEGLDSCNEPYGLAYPILKSVVTGKLIAAATECEEAISILDNVPGSASARAFAALHVQITGRVGRKSSTDRAIRDLALEAVNSPSICYQHSHVFDAAIVNQLLGRYGSKDRQYPRVRENYRSRDSEP